jgi:hypothetical protein
MWIDSGRISLKLGFTLTSSTYWNVIGTNANSDSATRISSSNAKGKEHERKKKRNLNRSFPPYQFSLNQWRPNLPWDFVKQDEGGVGGVEARRQSGPRERDERDGSSSIVSLTGLSISPTQLTMSSVQIAFWERETPAQALPLALSLFSLCWIHSLIRSLRIRRMAGVGTEAARPAPGASPFRPSFFFFFFFSPPPQADVAGVYPGAV